MDENKEENKIKKSRKTIIREWVTFFAVASFIIVALYATVTYIPPFSTHEHFVIVTGSMKPTINIGDVAYIDTEYNLDDLQVGDIVAFYLNINLSGEEEVVVHYIADIQYDELSNRVFYTKREGTTSWDNWEISDENIVGKYVFKIPFVGKILLFLDSIYGKLVFIADIIFIYLIFDILDENKKAKKLNKEKAV
ncbi:MAG: signal peptidase I [Clostridia bacterium]|nr:signal peptidase I [Clostridia bacterium]